MKVIESEKLDTEKERLKIEDVEGYNDSKTRTHEGTEEFGTK